MSKTPAVDGPRLPWAELAITAGLTFLAMGTLFYVGLLG